MVCNRLSPVWLWIWVAVCDRPDNQVDPDYGEDSVIKSPQPDINFQTLDDSSSMIESFRTNDPGNIQNKHDSQSLTLHAKPQLSETTTGAISTQGQPNTHGGDWHQNVMINFRTMNAEAWNLDGQPLGNNNDQQFAMKLGNMYKIKSHKQGPWYFKPRNLLEGSQLYYDKDGTIDAVRIDTVSCVTWLLSTDNDLFSLVIYKGHTFTQLELVFSRAGKEDIQFAFLERSRGIFCYAQQKNINGQFELQRLKPLNVEPNNSSLVKVTMGRYYALYEVLTTQTWYFLPQSSVPWKVWSRNSSTTAPTVTATDTHRNTFSFEKTTFLTG